jgi:hypothetical protein
LQLQCDHESRRSDHEERMRCCRIRQQVDELGTAHRSPNHSATQAQNACGASQ